MKTNAEMSVKRKSLILSAFLHAAVFCLVYVASGFAGKTVKPVIIDLTISPCGGGGKSSSEKPAPASSRKVAHRQKTVATKPRTDTSIEPVKRESMALVQMPSHPVNIMKQATTTDIGNDIDSSTDGSAVDGNKDGAGFSESVERSTTSAGGGGNGSGKSGEQLKNGYLSKHFKYIRDLIQGNIRYPSRARRMGWSGKVVVSFVIDVNGQVSQEKIVQSSGFEVLDKNVISTIDAVSPFPRPPIKAELRVPIIYRLE